MITDSQMLEVQSEPYFLHSLAAAASAQRHDDKIQQMRENPPKKFAVTSHIVDSLFLQGIKATLSRQLPVAVLVWKGNRLLMLMAVHCK